MQDLINAINNMANPNWVEILMLITTAGYFIATCFILRANNKTATIARKQFEAMSSPNIIIGFIQRDRIFYLCIRNEGNSTAEDIQIEVPKFKEWYEDIQEESRQKELIKWIIENLDENKFTLMPKQEINFTICCESAEFDLLKEKYGIISISGSYIHNTKQYRIVEKTYNLKIYNDLAFESKNELETLVNAVNSLTDSIQTKKGSWM